jgi:hypothetical protein
VFVITDYGLGFFDSGLNVNVLDLHPVSLCCCLMWFNPNGHRVKRNSNWGQGGFDFSTASSRKAYL